MSTNAEEILEQIKSLSPEEQDQVCDAVLQLQARQRALGKTKGEAPADPVSA